MKPFEDFAQYQREKQAESETHYAAKMLRKLLVAFYGEDGSRIIEQEAEDEFGFPWFNHHYGAPIALDAINMPTDTVQLIRNSNVTKAALWQKYFDVRRIYAKPFGLIFPVPGIGQFIRHDYEDLPLEPCFYHIVRIAASEEKRIVTQPIDAFMIALKRVWSP